MTDAEHALLLLVAQELKEMFQHFENPNKVRALGAAIAAVRREQIHPAASR